MNEQQRREDHLDLLACELEQFVDKHRELGVDPDLVCTALVQSGVQLTLECASDEQAAHDLIHHAVTIQIALFKAGQGVRGEVN